MQIPTSVDAFALRLFFLHRMNSNRTDLRKMDEKTKRMHLATAHSIELCLCQFTCSFSCPHSHTCTHTHGHFLSSLRSLFLSLFAFDACASFDVSLIRFSCAFQFVFILCVSLLRGIPLPRSTHWNYALIALRCAVAPIECVCCCIINIIERVSR